MNRRIHFHFRPKSKLKILDNIDRIDTFRFERSETGSEVFHKVGVTIKDQRGIYVSDPEKAIKYFKDKSEKEVKDAVFSKLTDEIQSQIRALLEMRVDEELNFEFCTYRNENKGSFGVELKFYDKVQPDRPDQKVHELRINLHVVASKAANASNSILGIIRSEDFKFTDMAKAQTVNDLKLDEKDTLILYKVKVLQSEE